MAVDTQQLLDDAKCIQTCIPLGMQMPVINSLLGQMAHETDIDEMIAGAQCVQTCIPNGMQGAVLITIAANVAASIPPSFGTPANLAYNSGIFTWDYSGYTNPDHWQIQAQLDDGTWVENFPDASGNMTCPGDQRAIAIDIAAIITQYPNNNGYLRVVGKNADNSDATNTSAALLCGPF